MQHILKYFPDLSSEQIEKYIGLGNLYKEWNEKINLISRKDVGFIFSHHILHSLSIAYFYKFKSGTEICDVGTGGGLPGIPLAIFFPKVKFHLIDSIGKKILVTKDIIEKLKLSNCSSEQVRMEEHKKTYDYITARACTNIPDFCKLVTKNIHNCRHNSFPNGIIYLKGGDFDEELKFIKMKYSIRNLNDIFEEEYFDTKKIILIKAH